MLMGAAQLPRCCCAHLFCDALSLPRGAYLDFLRPREWETIVGRYRALFAAHAIQPQDVFLRLRNGRRYIGSHLQEYLVSLDAEYEGRLTRWTLGVQRALERGGALPLFWTVVTATPEGTDSALESDLSERGQLEPGGADLGVTEGGQTARNRGTSRCACCWRALEDPTGGSAADSLRACIPCTQGEQVHASCMLDRAERLASGRADQQQCVSCRSEWPARNRSPHPAEMAEDLPRPLPGGKWPAVEGELQFVELIEEDGAKLLQPASNLTTDSHETFELMVRTNGRSPTSSFLLCSLFSDALSLPQRAYLDFPGPGEWQAAASHYREAFAAYAIRAQDISLRLPNRRIYILLHVEEFLAGLDSTWENRLTRWTLGVRNALEAGDAPPPFPTAEFNLGAQTELEAGDELPPFPTAAGATPEGMDPGRATRKLGSKWIREAPWGVPLEVVAPRGIGMPS